MRLKSGLSCPPGLVSWEGSTVFICFVFTCLHHGRAALHFTVTQSLESTLFRPFTVSGAFEKIKLHLCILFYFFWWPCFFLWMLSGLPFIILFWDFLIIYLSIGSSHVGFFSHSHLGTVVEWPFLRAQRTLVLENIFLLFQHFLFFSPLLCAGITKYLAILHSWFVFFLP